MTPCRRRRGSGDVCWSWVSRFPSVVRLLIVPSGPLPSRSLFAASVCPLPRSNLLTVLSGSTRHTCPMDSGHRCPRYHGNASRASGSSAAAPLLRVQLKQKHEEQNQNDRHHLLDDELEAIFHPGDVVLLRWESVGVRSEGVPLPEVPSHWETGAEPRNRHQNMIETELSAKAVRKRERYRPGGCAGRPLSPSSFTLLLFHLFSFFSPSELSFTVTHAVFSI